MSPAIALSIRVMRRCDNSAGIRSTVRLTQLEYDRLVTRPVSLTVGYVFVRLLWRRASNDAAP